MQAIQSLILPQTMSPDNSSLPVQAGFTRTFSIASLLLFSYVFLDEHLRFPPSSLRFTYLHYLVAFVTGVFLVGHIVLRCSGLEASWFYWVVTCCLFGHSVVGAFVLVARFKMLFLVQGYFLEYIIGFNVV